LAHSFDFGTGAGLASYTVDRYFDRPFSFNLRLKPDKAKPAMVVESLEQISEARRAAVQERVIHLKVSLASKFITTSPRL
jgi:hypothetical protein